jgi:hypothetical protein
VRYLHTVIAVGTLAFLQGCGASQPYVQDWHRERITKISNAPIQVSVCFDMGQHSKEQVYDIAREECSVRITEVQNLVQFSDLQNVRYQHEAEGRHFSGPIARQKRMQAMIDSLQLVYVENDKWECPILTPNRITFECQYNPNAQDSSKKQRSVPQQTPTPELPPELPEDLKPQ